MDDTRMPALYIGHGAPPLLDDPVWSGELRAWTDDYSDILGSFISRWHGRG